MLSVGISDTKSVFFIFFSLIFPRTLIVSSEVSRVSLQLKQLIYTRSNKQGLFAFIVGKVRVLRRANLMILMIWRARKVLKKYSLSTNLIDLEARL